MPAMGLTIRGVSHLQGLHALLSGSLQHAEALRAAGTGLGAEARNGAARGLEGHHGEAGQRRTNSSGTGTGASRAGGRVSRSTKPSRTANLSLCCAHSSPLRMWHEVMHAVVVIDPPVPSHDAIAQAVDA